MLCLSSESASGWESCLGLSRFLVSGFLQVSVDLLFLFSLFMSLSACCCPRFVYTTIILH